MVTVWGRQSVHSRNSPQRVSHCFHVASLEGPPGRAGSTSCEAAGPSLCPLPQPSSQMSVCFHAPGRRARGKHVCVRLAFRPAAGAPSPLWATTLEQQRAGRTVWGRAPRQFKESKVARGEFQDTPAPEALGSSLGAACAVGAGEGVHWTCTCTAVHSSPV